MSSNVVKNQLKLAKEALSVDDYAKARTHATAALDYDERNYMAMLLLAAAWQREGDYHKSEFYFQRAIFEKPDLLPAYQGLYKLYSAPEHDVDQLKLEKVLQQLRRLLMNDGELKSKEDAARFLEYYLKEIDLQRESSVESFTKLCFLCERLLPGGDLHKKVSEHLTVKVKVDLYRKIDAARCAIDSVRVSNLVRQKKNVLGAPPVFAIEREAWNNVMQTNSQLRIEQQKQLLELVGYGDAPAVESFVTFLVRKLGATFSKESLLKELGTVVQLHFNEASVYSRQAIHAYINLQDCAWDEYDLGPLKRATENSGFYPELDASDTDSLIFSALIRAKAETLVSSLDAQVVPPVAYLQTLLATLNDVSTAELLARHADQAHQLFGLELKVPRLTALLKCADLAPNLASKIEGYKRVLALIPTHVQSLVVLGFALMERGEIPQAQKSFEDAVCVEPKNAKAAAGLGRSLYLQGKEFSRATSLLDSAAQVLDDPKVHFWRSLVLWELYLSEGETALDSKTPFEKIEDGFKKACNSNLPSGNCFLGWYTALVLKDKDAAIALFKREKPQSLEPRAAECYCSLLMDANDRMSAASLCTWFSMASKSEAWALRQLGLLRMREQNFEVASQIFKKLVRKDSHDSLALELLAECYLRLGKYPAAERVLEHESLSHKSRSLCYLRAVLYQKLARYNQSLKSIESMLEASKGFRAAEVLAKSLLVLTSRRYALDCERKGAYGLAVDEAIRGLCAACDLLKLKDLGVDKVHTIAKWAADCLVITGKRGASAASLYLSNKLEEADSILRLFDESWALPSLQSDSDTNPFAVTCELDQTPLGLAARYYSLAISASRRIELTQVCEAHYWHDLGVCYLIMSKLSGREPTLLKCAEKCLQEALLKCPSEAWFYVSLGNVYLLSNLDKAQHCFVKAYELNPKLTVSLCSLGFVLLKRRQFKIAREIFHKAETLSPAQADVWIGLAITALKSEDKTYDYTVDLEHAMNLLNENAVTKLRYRPFFVLYANLFASDRDKCSSVIYALNKAIEHESSDYSAWVLRGLLFEREQNYEEAHFCYAKAQSPLNLARASISAGLASKVALPAGLEEPAKDDAELIKAIQLYFSGDYGSSLSILERYVNGTGEFAHLVQLVSLKVLYSLLVFLPEEKRADFIPRGRSQLITGVKRAPQLFIESAAAWALRFKDEELLDSVLSSVNWPSLHPATAKTMAYAILALKNDGCPSKNSRATKFLMAACHNFPNHAWPFSLLSLTIGRNPDAVNLARWGIALDAAGMSPETYNALAISLIRSGPPPRSDGSASVIRHYEEIKRLVSKTLIRFPNFMEREHSVKSWILLGLVLKQEAVWTMVQSSPDSDTDRKRTLSHTESGVWKCVSLLCGQSTFPKALETYAKVYAADSALLGELLKPNQSNISAVTSAMKSLTSVAKEKATLLKLGQRDLFYHTLRALQFYQPSAETKALESLNSFKKLFVVLEERSWKDWVHLSRLYVRRGYIGCANAILDSALRTLDCKDSYNVERCTILCELLKLSVCFGSGCGEELFRAQSLVTQALELVTNNGRQLLGYLAAIKFFQALICRQHAQYDGAYPVGRFEKLMSDSMYAGRFSHLIT